MFIRWIALLSISWLIPASYAADLSCEARVTGQIPPTFYKGDENFVQLAIDRLDILRENLKTLAEGNRVALIEGKENDLKTVAPNSLDLALAPDLNPSAGLVTRLAVVDNMIATVRPGGQIRAWGFAFAELEEVFNHLHEKYGEDVVGQFKVFDDGGVRLTVAIYSKPGMRRQIPSDFDNSLNFGQNW